MRKSASSSSADIISASEKKKEKKQERPPYNGKGDVHECGIYVNVCTLNALPMTRLGMYKSVAFI